MLNLGINQCGYIFANDLEFHGSVKKLQRIDREGFQTSKMIANSCQCIDHIPLEYTRLILLNAGHALSAFRASIRAAL